MSPVSLQLTVITRLIMGILIVGLFLFGSAGSFAYWQGWVYLVVLFGPMIIVGTYLLRRDPELLERRMRHREKEKHQKLVIFFSNLLALIAFLVPGLDYRLGWSEVPLILVLVADCAVLAGYLLFFLVMKVNSYASRVVEVEAGQKVITTGPYSVVRHPLYLAWSIMIIFTPLALGSFWALIAFVPMVLLLIPRILNEEKVLRTELPGYEEYTRQTKSRLIPYIW